jgi:hypothetical protein
MGAILRIVFSVAALALAGFAVFVLIDRSRVAEQAAERRALLTRDAELSRVALAPGSPLACLDGGAGEAVENACEKMVFGTAQSAAAATAYMDARLKLLADAAAERDAGTMALFASTRRAVALDRFGVAAHVLSIRDGCTPEKCAAFALVEDSSALKSNLSAQVYDQYVSRYVAEWNAPARSAEKAPAMSVLSSPPPPPVASLNGQTTTPAIKPGEHWDFPSAASIPPVSIMNSEPPLPKGAEAQAQAPGQAQAQGAQPQANGKPPAKPATDAKAPASPKIPTPQAAPSATR